jgi:muramoyltetrapeptide carboxypeptidase
MHIRVVAPGAAVDRDGVEKAAALISALGYQVSFGEHLFDRYRYLAGSLSARYGDLQQASRDGAVGAIWLARGGTGAGELMLQLGDWFALKPIIGYSDNCCLLAEALRRNGTAIHGPVFEEVALRSSEHASLRPDALDVLSLLEPRCDLQPTRSFELELVSPGPVHTLTGRLVGGNVTTLCSMLGTPYSPSFDNGLLLLEDVGEPYYRIERMLVQLAHAGMLDRVCAVILGDFVNCPRRSVVHTIEEIFLEHLSPRGIPLYNGAPFGHGERNSPWRLGSPASIDSSGVLKLQ